MHGGGRKRAVGRNVPPPPPEKVHRGLGKLWFLTPLTLSRSGQHRKEGSFTGVPSSGKTGCRGTKASTAPGSKAP